mmetsp:Transcript_9616/g.15759  ORF Transcript_9616/g.15759 Transcript_9616/m.15759 type:complete len:81 (-) Transcript_9616:225-467(-)
MQRKLTATVCISSIKFHWNLPGIEAKVPGMSECEHYQSKNQSVCQQLFGLTEVPGERLVHVQLLKGNLSPLNASTVYIHF